jgi:hypothetical protein
MFDRQNLATKGSGRSTHRSDQVRHPQVCREGLSRVRPDGLQRLRACLEGAEVAPPVADKVRPIGNVRGADALERQLFNDRCDWGSFKTLQMHSQRGLKPPLSDAY